MDEEKVHGSVQNIEKQNSSGCSRNDERFSETLEKLPDMSCSSRSVERTEVVRVFENQASCSESCAKGNVIEDNKVVVGCKEEKNSWVIDVKYGDDEKVCRICHLNSEQPLKLGEKSDLMILGCGCKGELSVAHLHCAEAWFKLKGNRTCEICEQTVNNVQGVATAGFMEEWNNSRLNRDEPGLSERSEREGCWQGQPLCNFIIACLVIAFVIPWFFRINLW